MRTREYGVLFGLALIWGASFLFIKVAVREVSPAVVAEGRLLCSLVTLGVVAATRPARVAGLWRYWRRSLGVGAINYVGPYLLIAWGETHIASGLTSILNATTPLFAVPLAAGWPGLGREALTLRRMAGVVVGFAGVAVLVGPSVLQGPGGGPLGTLGEAAVLLASAAYAVGALLSRGYAGSAQLVGPLGSQLAAALLLVPVVAVWNPPAHLPSPAAIGAIVTLGVMGTAVAYLLYFWLINHVGATRTTLVTYLLPCTALIWGVALLGETVMWNALAGLALVLVGTMVTNGALSGLMRRRRSRAGTPAVVAARGEPKGE